MSAFDKIRALTADGARPWEVTESYDAPPMPPGLVDAIRPLQPHPTTFREFLAFKPGTDFYNGRTAKGRARRS